MGKDREVRIWSGYTRLPCPPMTSKTPCIVVIQAMVRPSDQVNRFPFIDIYVP